MERFSMKEWKPEKTMDKIQQLEEIQTLLDRDKQPLIAKKRDLEIELVEVNVQLRNELMGSIPWNNLNSNRGRIISSKNEVEKKLLEINTKIRKTHSDREALKLELRKRPNEAIQNELFMLRDKYLAFSADTTRVSSMRAMSSKFVEEIQGLLKLFPQ